MQDHKPQHPSRQELVELFVETLSPERAAEIREHLSDCEACTRQFLELTRLPDDAPHLGAEETARAWQRLETAIDAEEIEKPATVLPFERQAPPVAPPTSTRTGHPSWQLLAAMIAGAAIGLLSGGSVLTKPESIYATEATVLIPADFTNRGTVDPKAVNCPAPGGAFEWQMSPELESDATRKQIFVEIRTAAGKRIDLQAHPLDSAGDLKLTVPRSRIPDGEYQLLLKLTEEGKPTEVFEVSVSCP